MIITSVVAADEIKVDLQFPLLVLGMIGKQVTFVPVLVPDESEFMVTVNIFLAHRLSHVVVTSVAGESPLKELVKV